MLFRIKLANRIVQIESLYNLVFAECRNYIIPFGTDVENDIEIRITEGDLALERKLLSNRYNNDKTSHDVYSLDRVLEVSAVHRKVLDGMLRFDTLLVHGALMAVEGRGYLVTASSGVGKSTRAMLWKRVIPDSFIVNGDKPLFTFTESGVMGFGTPWCGKEHWNVNAHVPLEAILFLERMEQGADVVEESTSDALLKLLRQAHIPNGRDSQQVAISLLSKMVKRTRCFSYRVAPTEEAVLEAYSRIADPS